MLRVLCLIAAVIGTLMWATPGIAQVGKGLSGPHFELNIIGVPKNKTASLTDSNRHTIFAPLDRLNTMPNVKIYVTGDADPTTDGTQCGDRFQVLDGNATDGEATLLVPCEVGGMSSFEVYAVGLGTPGGSAGVDVVCTFQSTITLSSDAATLCGVKVGGFDFEVKRDAGKPYRQNISSVFRASGCVDVVIDGIICGPGDTAFSNVNIAELLSYYWDYDNYGLKLMKVRFYPTTSGSWTVLQ